MSDPYGSDYDLLSQDKYTVCLSQGMSRKVWPVAKAFLIGLEAYSADWIQAQGQIR